MKQREYQVGWVVVPQVRGPRETAYGIRTRYLYAGDGEPVVLIHGGGHGASAEAIWTRTIPVLAQQFRVYALDLIGWGYSDKPPIEYSYQTFVDHVAGFVDALGLDRVRVAGDSFGAYAALKYALDHPMRVVAAAVVGGSTALADACGLSDEGKGAPLASFDGSKESLRRYLEVFFEDQRTMQDELLETRLAVVMQPGYDEMNASMKRFRELATNDPNYRQVYEIRDRLTKLTIPWCMIWGERDRTSPMDPVGNGLRTLLPHVPFYVIPGAGHQVQTERPDECNRILLDFFGARVAVGAPA